MRLLPITLFTGICAAASAQTTQAELDIVQAYGHLQTDTPFMLTQSGTQTRNGVTRTFTSQLSWSLSSTTSTLPQVELDDYDTTSGSMVLVRRYVGDGRTLWFYDLQNRRYMASLYSYYGAQAPTDVAPPPDGYAPVLLAQLFAESKSPSSWMVRLMREANPGSSPVAYPSQYNTWDPGYAPSVPPTSPPTQDPLVPSRTYSSGGATEWVVYGLLNPDPIRTVAFELNNPDVSSGETDYHLQEVDFAEAGPNRFSNWTITVTDPIPSLTTAFQPYSAAVTRGWQFMPAPKVGQGTY